MNTKKNAGHADVSASAEFKIRPRGNGMEL